MEKNTPLLSIRLRVNDTQSTERWRECFESIRAYGPCCDEIWFSTGIGAPPVEWHIKNASVISGAARDLEQLGIRPSLQFQGTLGHGDALGAAECFDAKTWRGWTDWQGRETLYCSCPRQEGFHEYLRKISSIYAQIGFDYLWIDDDLRIYNHLPADNSQRNVGCWCDDCLKEFGRLTGKRWDRDGLHREISVDDALSCQWREFSVSGLCLVAGTIAKVFCGISPKTKMGLQHGSGEGSVDQVKAILGVLHKESRQKVGLRPGGCAYYDENPNEVVEKSLQSGRFIDMIGNPGYVERYVAEIESWPRTYYSKSPQGVLAEGWAALMYGMNGISCFITNGEMEDYSLYGRTFWKRLSEASAALRGYANAIEDAAPAGIGMPAPCALGMRRCAIPVVAGTGGMNVMTEEETNRSVSMMNSREVQKLRDEVDRRAGGLPAVVKSPFLGLVQIHADGDGFLRTVSLMNLTISEQGPVELLLRNLPKSWDCAVWHEMCKEPVNLELDRRDGGIWVTIPRIGAWNGGYLAGDGKK